MKSLKVSLNSGWLLFFFIFSVGCGPANNYRILEDPHHLVPGPALATLPSTSFQEGPGEEIVPSTAADPKPGECSGGGSECGNPDPVITGKMLGEIQVELVSAKTINGPFAPVSPAKMAPIAGVPIEILVKGKNSVVPDSNLTIHLYVLSEDADNLEQEDLTAADLGDNDTNEIMHKYLEKNSILSKAVSRDSLYGIAGEDANQYRQFRTTLNVPTVGYWRIVLEATNYRGSTSRLLVAIPVKAPKLFAPDMFANANNLDDTSDENLDSDDKALETSSD